MVVSRKVLIFIICLFIALCAIVVWLQKSSGCSAGYWLNPDMACRVTDSSNGKYLIEYFNLDTNELRLYLQQNGKDLLIEHPYGKVKNYSNKIDSNIIQFDSTDSQYLIVNGERFPVMEKE